MHRIAAILLTGWALMVAPALCTAGVLEHLCSCTACHQDSDSDHRPQSHECQADPCDTHVIQHRPTYKPDELKAAVQPACLASSGVETQVVPEDFTAPGGAGVLLTYPPSFSDRGLPLLV